MLRPRTQGALRQSLFTSVFSPVFSSVFGGAGGVAPFSPLSLFASGEEGVWYEPSTSTCFTDTGGTTPATYGDAVAYLQDKSGNGNHATQGTLTNRPTLARVPSTGRRNLLERSQEFDDAVWTTSFTTVATTAETPPGSFSGTVYKLAEDSSSNAHRFWQRGPESLITSQTWTLSVYIKDAGDGRFVQLRAVGVGNGKAWATFDPTDGTLTQSGGTDLVGTPTSTAIGDGWYRVEMTSSTDIVNTGDGPDITLSNSATGGEIPTYTGDGSSGVYIFGAQFEIGTSATAYQKVVDEYDITETGVDSLDSLFDDQVDDVLPWAAPADTDYTISYVNTSGTVTTLTSQSLSGATDILLDPALVAYVAVDRALTAGETTDLETYLGALA